MPSSVKEMAEAWQDFYPDDLVLPPIDAVDTDGTFYRLVKTLPPSANCFASTHEDQPK